MDNSIRVLASTRLEAVSNIATVIAAALISVVLVKVYLLPTSPRRAPGPPASTAISIGANLKDKIPGIAFRGSNSTLILALSTHCHFCTESAPFFQRLQNEVPTGFRTVALFPESAGEAKQYLTKQGVHVDEIKQVTLASAGVRGTPTMILANGSGTVTQIWTGRPEQKDEESMISALRAAVQARPRADN